MSKERIHKAAIKTLKGIYQGRTHEEAMGDMMWHNDYPNGSEVVQGFITSEGRFVDRTEAAQIAYKAGQTEENMGSLQSRHLSVQKKVDLICN